MDRIKVNTVFNFAPRSKCKKVEDDIRRYITRVGRKNGVVRFNVTSLPDESAVRVILFIEAENVGDAELAAYSILDPISGQLPD